MTRADPVDVLVIGESLVDELRRGDGRVLRRPGGSPLNVAVGLARLGRAVALRTSYGDDPEGRLIEQALASAGVRPIVDALSPHPSSIARAEILPDGSARYAFELAWDPAPATRLPRSRILHVGSLGAILAPGRDVVRRACAEHDGPVSIDLNVRPAVADAEPGSREALGELIGLADVVKASDEDLAWLHPGRDPFEVARGWVERGASLACVTLGDRGVYAVSARGESRRPPHPGAVVDTVGAGDTVMAVLIDEALTAAAGDPALDPDAAALERTLVRATTAAAITLGRPGAELPTARELADATAHR